MITAVLELELGVFDDLFEAFPELRLRLVDIHAMPETSALYWFDGVDEHRLDSRLRASSSVTECRKLESTGTEHLYKVVFDPESAASSLYESIVELDGGVIQATCQDGSWTVELFFPSREAISTFFGRASEMDAAPVLVSVTTDQAGPETRSYGLTPLQRETLLTAAELGYFAVPKEVSLIDLADELGVSDQAASERLRRGVLALIDSTIREAGEPVLQD